MLLPLPLHFLLCTHSPSTFPPSSVQASQQYDTISLPFRLPLPSLPYGIDRKPRQKLKYRKEQYGRGGGRSPDKEEATHSGRLKLKCLCCRFKENKEEIPEKRGLSHNPHPHMPLDHSCLLPVLTPTDLLSGPPRET